MKLLEDTFGYEAHLNRTPKPSSAASAGSEESRALFAI